MPSPKIQLKAAKAALDAKKYADALKSSKEALEIDPPNYLGHLFLARSYDKLGEFQNAENTYLAASRLKQVDAQVWIGLRELYESQGSSQVSKHVQVSIKLAHLYESQNDAARCQSAVNKAIEFARSKGTSEDYRTALMIQLPSPGNSIYTLLEGRIPAPAHTFLRLIETTEKQEDDKIKKEIESRRTRIGATRDKVTVEVKREVYKISPLDSFYDGLINWTTDDEQRKIYEHKRLTRAYECLLVLTGDDKIHLRNVVTDMARGLVVIKRPFPLAWEIMLEWADIENLDTSHYEVWKEYTELFPETGLSNVLSGYITLKTPKVDQSKKNQPVIEDDSSEDGGVSLESPPLDPLLLISEGIGDALNSPLAHRVAAEFYLSIDEHESAVEKARICLELLSNEVKKSGLPLQNNIDSLKTTLATALITYQTPRNHLEAKDLFEDVLSRHPTRTSALLGVGLILEEDERYSEASEYLMKALERDQSNLQVGVEAAWCDALTGDYSSALERLNNYLDRIPDTYSNATFKAQTFYRIGRCQWELDPSKPSRKDRQGPYANFLEAIKTDINFAPAYTSLGIYYEDYGSSKKRSRQCFQKAFDLSAGEVIAAERLAKSFADQGEWDFVEIIATRVIDSGNARPPPGSHKKALSWPFSAMGVVQMNHLQYQEAIVSFQAALRINPDDYHAYIGLGESYHNSGRYISALRTFNFAESTNTGLKMKKNEEDWFTNYMIGNVNRELGSYNDAIISYQKVLDTRKIEFGVHMALVQTFLEKAEDCMNNGFHGRAIECAKEAIDTTLEIIKYRTEAFNLWKSVADASAIFSLIQNSSNELPIEKLITLLEKDIDLSVYDNFEEYDTIGKSKILEMKEDLLKENINYVRTALFISILAHKRAIDHSISQRHTQAIAWYNLGWTEYLAYEKLEMRANPITDVPGDNKKFLRAAVQCFKKAIEIEASNSSFWNSLGVATSKLNSKVSQHCFIRSINLNARDYQSWTNLGALYLLNQDYDLAHQAFSKSQSLDPDNSHAWIGEGIIALLVGNPKEALIHFTHAFEISKSSTAVVKKEISKYSFDQIIQSGDSEANKITSLQPILALQQLRSLNGSDLPFDHLSALFDERIGNYSSAITSLTRVCEKLEKAYDESQTDEIVLLFAQSKSDLSRNLLATQNYESAAEEAEFALLLVEEKEDEMCQIIRLSCHLTLGLAKFYLKDIDASIEVFKTALTETKSNQDVICLLAEVLWSQGGNDERSVAKEQLFESISKGSDHVGTLVLLGVMAILEEDVETATIVRSELESRRTSIDVSIKDLERIERVLEILVELENPSGTTSTTNQEKLFEMQRSVMSSPHLPTGWIRIAEETSSSSSALLAVDLADRSVPPRGSLTSKGLAEILCKTGRVKDAQKAIFISPSLKEPWMTLSRIVTK